MTSGQWDLNALEALEREALEVFDVVDVPERVRRSSIHNPHPPHSHHHHTHAIVATGDMMDIELEDHIKHCSCTCNHMGYGNFMDYQVIIFYVFMFHYYTHKCLENPK